MLISFFSFVVLSSPFILLALAVGLAGPTIKAKVRLGLVGALLLFAATILVIKEILLGKAPNKYDTAP